MRSVDHPLKLFLVAVGLPAAVVLIDEQAMAWLRGHGESLWAWAAGESLWAWAAVDTVFVVQVALLSAIVGRFLRHPLVRWAVFLWAMALVDILVLQMSMLSWRGDLGGCLAFALISAQVGMLAVWTILGPAPWPWRLPFVVVAIVPLAWLTVVTEQWGDNAWLMILLIQSFVVGLVCVVLRIMGHRMRSTGAPVDAEPSVPWSRQLQFGIGHMLVWTAALVPMLVFLKVTDVRRILDLGWEELSYATMIAVCLAVVSLTSLWAAMSGRHWGARLMALALVLPAMGCLILMTAGTRIVNLRTGWLNWAIAELAWAWVLWTSLAGGFLFGLLLMLRANGYRLVRRPKPNAASHDAPAPASASPPS
jgi:hypothetical protein